MNSEPTTKLSKLFDLTSYETNSYLALLEKDNLSAVEVAKISGVPRGRIYEILNNLSEKGLCRSISGKTKKYKASNPDFLNEMIKPKLELIKSEIEQETNEFKDEIERRKEEFYEEIERRKRDFDRELEKRKEKFDLEIERKKRNTNSKIEGKKQELRLLEKKNDEFVEKLKGVYSKSRGKDNPLDYVEILRNPNQIHRKFIELYSKSQHEVLAFIKPPYSHNTQRQLEEQFKVQDEGIERGVVRRGIFELQTEDDAREFFSVFKSNKGKKGEKFKVIDKLPIKFFVFDEYACYFAMEDPVENITSLTMLVAEHNALAKSFKALFESFWEKARDYYIIDGKKCHLYES